jgi:hypothetical protein
LLPAAPIQWVAGFGYSLGAALGPRLTAGAVASFGGYSEVIAMHASLLLLAALLLGRLGPFPRRWGKLLEKAGVGAEGKIQPDARVGWAPAQGDWQ